MLSKISKARALLAVLVLLAAIAVLINRNATVSVHASGSTPVNPLTKSVTAKLL